MLYYYSRTLDMKFYDAIAAAKEAFKRHNFRVITEIDMKEHLKKELNVEFKPYVILGVCNPQLTYRLLQAQDQVGTMLPCNIILQERHKNRVEISTVDPVASMQAINHVVVEQIAKQIRSELYEMIDDIGINKPG
jgi:uncharacterized protein (DUF302 family)